MTYAVAFSRCLETAKFVRRNSWPKERHIFLARSNHYTYHYNPHNEEENIFPIVSAMENCIIPDIKCSEYFPYFIEKEDAVATDWEVTDISISDHISN